MVEAHLKQAERHAALGEEIIADQKRRISELERNGPTQKALWSSLQRFEEPQRMHLADRDRLRKELSKILGGAGLP
ncbi:MAG: hypothetical protein ACR652_20900 [Methylocystis sp.]|uniref:hypothetical protein n=1 Tax=Methylocystis sp. TaxID=1911079 RepID=UPI003DA2BC72